MKVKPRLPFSPPFDLSARNPEPFLGVFIQLLALRQHESLPQLGDTPLGLFDEKLPFKWQRGKTCKSNIEMTNPSFGWKQILEHNL